MVGAVIARAWERLTGLGTPEVRSGYLLATRAVEERHARWLWEETHRRDTDAGTQASLALLRFDSRPWVGKIEADTLVVIPTKDQLVPPAWQYQLAAAIGDPQIVELVGVRHEAPWTHSDRLADEIVTMRAAMAEASRVVLGGFELGTDVSVTRWPHRYMDRRGAVMWRRVTELLQQAERKTA